MATIPCFFFFFTSKKISLYVVKLSGNHFSRSTSSCREARAASLILKGEGINSNTCDRICTTKKEYKYENSLTKQKELQKYLKYKRFNLLKKKKNLSNENSKILAHFYLFWRDNQQYGPTWTSFFIWMIKAIQCC